MIKDKPRCNIVTKIIIVGIYKSPILILLLSSKWRQSPLRRLTSITTLSVTCWLHTDFWTHPRLKLDPEKNCRENCVRVLFYPQTHFQVHWGWAWLQIQSTIPIWDQVNSVNAAINWWHPYNNRLAEGNFAYLECVSFGHGCWNCLGGGNRVLPRARKKEFYFVSARSCAEPLLVKEACVKSTLVLSQPFLLPFTPFLPLSLLLWI